ncbi:uncharacterized protein LOC132037468 isoform X1 [Lycium ferocissimum]|uniref:uncharacterized protein LOC132037468 isoform X1 n=1 Tax=Lycium ferocissimum TaxID=112874 RepID=UPI00281616F2|nr:uncharacterized protein LOC132037468 isoform X1 [Lycium ferocissimum]
MEKVAAAQTSCSCSCSCYNNFLVPKLKGGGFLFLQAEQRSKKWRSQPLIVKSQMISNATTYTSRISTDIPLYEIPGASFDRYLENKPRVFKAIFPDKRRSHQLNEDEWRIHMLPIEFLFMTAWPVIDMRLRCKSKGIEYPPGVPNNVSKVLELDIIRWELQGLDDVLKPSQFSLAVKGSLYPYRVGPRSRLKGQLQMSISFVLSPMLALVPDDVRRDVAESVLRGLLQNMKSKVNGSLLSDYAEFKRETQKNLV